MDISLLQFLRCPLHPHLGRLRILSSKNGSGFRSLISDSGLQCQHCGQVYPIIDGIPVMLDEETLKETYLEAEQRQWDMHSETYDARRAQDPGYMAGIHAVLKAANLQEGDFILDACCGTGLTVRNYPCCPSRTIAFDLSVNSLRYFRKAIDNSNIDNINFVAGDISQLPFEGKVFSKVLCANAIQHIPKEILRRTCIKEFARVTHSRARVVVSTHNFSIGKKRRGWAKEGTAGSHSGDVQYIYRYELAEFQSLLASFLIVDRIVGSGYPLIYNYKLSSLSRLVEWHLQKIGKCAVWANMLVGICHTPQD